MIYTAGYTGRKPERLKEIAEQLDAVVCDIRFSPNSRNPQWRRESLESLLGGRYRWLFHLGNRNYRNDLGVSLINARLGIDEARRVAGTGNVILLCVCADHDGCHRSVVADLLRGFGHEVAELGWERAG